MMSPQRLNTEPTTAASKGNQVAITGFITWLLITTAVVMYFMWAFLPSDMLDEALLNVYPDKYWAVAMPALLVMSVVYYETTHLLIFLYRTNPLTDGFYVADTNVKEDPCSLETLSDMKESVPPLTDIPVSVSSRLLFQPWI